MADEKTVDEETIRALERLVVHGGSITSRAATVHPVIQALSLSQYRALAFVASAPDGLRIVELARLQGSQPQATSRITQRLEARGLVAFERGTQTDRRAVVVRLTELGERTWEEISARRRALLAAALEGVELPAGTGAVLEAIASAIENLKQPPSNSSSVVSREMGRSGGPSSTTSRSALRNGRNPGAPPVGATPIVRRPG